MKIYIAGKVSGLDHYDVVRKFAAAEKEIREAGYIPVNPIEEVDNPQEEWQPAMKKCIAAMMQCDAVYFLRDYTDSKGALIEYHLARDIDMPRVFSKKGLNNLSTKVLSHEKIN